MHYLETYQPKTKKLKSALFASLTGRWMEWSIAIVASAFALLVFAMVALNTANIQIAAITTLAGPMGLGALMLLGLHATRSWAIGEHKLLIVDGAMVAAVIALAHLALRSMH